MSSAKRPVHKASGSTAEQAVSLAIRLDALAMMRRRDLDPLERAERLKMFTPDLLDSVKKEYA